MHLIPLLLLSLCASGTAHWRGEHEECHERVIRETVTVTETKTAHCSAFGTFTTHSHSASRSYLASLSSASHSTTPFSSISPSSSPLSSTSQSSSGVSSSATSSSTSPAAAIPSQFLILANSPTSPTSNQNYAIVNPDGSMTFNTNDPKAATSFTLSSPLGHLIANGLYGELSPPTNGVSAVIFSSSASKISSRHSPEKRQTASTPLTCTVTASNTGSALLTCSASSATTQQVCGQSFYLGTTNQCQPLVLAAYDPATATTSGGSGSGTPGTPSAQFQLQAYDPSTSTGPFAVYTTSQSNTVLAFAALGHGAVFSLDGAGHLVSVGPTASGAVVTYAAVFPVGSLFGPVIEQTGGVPAGYVAIVCAMQAATGTLTCTDGANGVDAVLQVCSGDLLYLGQVVGQGCSVPLFKTV